MDLHMNKHQKLGIILAIVIVVSLVAAFWAAGSLFLPPPQLARALRYPPPRGDIELYYSIQTVISTVNVTLLIILFATYIDIYRKIKSEFTIGLMIFTSTLLFYALFSNPIVHRVFGFMGFGLGPFAMLPELFTFGALIVLLYLTFKY